MFPQGERSSNSRSLFLVREDFDLTVQIARALFHTVESGAQQHSLVLSKALSVIDDH